MKAFFSKELFSSPFYVGGRVVRFIEVSDDTGILETENESLIKALRDAAAKHVGGIVEINEQEFGLKKKEPPTVKQPKPLQTLTISQDPRQLGIPIKPPEQGVRRAAAGAAVLAAADKPITPAPAPEPKTRVAVSENRPTVTNKTAPLPAPKKK